MKWIYILLIIGILIATVIFFRYQTNVYRQSELPKSTSSITPSKPTPTLTPTPLSTISNNYSIALISIEDKSANEPIGCGDSIVIINKTASGSGTIELEKAFYDLLSEKNMSIKHNNKSLYNPLYQSNLNIDSIAETPENLSIYLKGDLMVGGVCDIPRIKEQLIQTAVHNSNYSRSTISFFINEKNLDEALSLK